MTTGSSTAPALSAFHSTSSSDFPFRVLRLSFPRQARGLSLSKAGQVSEFRLSEEESKNRFQKVLFMQFLQSKIGNRQSKITLSLYLPAREGKAESIEIAPRN